MYFRDLLSIALVKPSKLRKAGRAKSRRPRRQPDFSLRLRSEPLEERRLSAYMLTLTHNLVPQRRLRCERFPRYCLL